MKPKPTKYQNRKAPSLIYPFGILLIVGSLSLSSCGDLSNEPEVKPAPSVAPKEPPKTSETPQPQKPETSPKSQEQKQDQDPKAKKETQWLLNMCEAERQWAYTAGLIDASQLRLFRTRNLAPVYLVPGQRQSGIESWFSCWQALQMNGFIHVGEEKVGVENPNQMGKEEETTVVRKDPENKPKYKIEKQEPPDSPKVVQKTETRPSNPATDSKASTKPNPIVVASSYTPTVAGKEPETKIKKQEPAIPPRVAENKPKRQTELKPLGPIIAPNLPAKTKSIEVASPLPKKEDNTPSRPLVTNEPPRQERVPEKIQEKADERSRHQKMCEAERQWAYTTGFIDASQLRLFRNRNFAPVYSIPGQRQSGIDGFFPCERSLRMNGFI